MPSRDVLLVSWIWSSCKPRATANARVRSACADRVSLSPLVRATRTGRPLRTRSSCMSWSSARARVERRAARPRRRGGPLEQISLHQPPVPRPGRLARPREPVARQVHQVEARQPEGVEQRGLPRRPADARQAPPPQSGRSAGSTCPRWTARSAPPREAAERGHQRVGERPDELDREGGEGGRRSGGRAVGRSTSPPGRRRCGGRGRPIAARPLGLTACLTPPAWSARAR